MPEPQSRWASNLGIRIHYLDTTPDADPALTPIVFVPGALGTAEDYREEMAALAPRRCIAISLRGRGQSDAPTEGYSFLTQVRDIETVIEESGIEDFCLMGYSMGVAFALGYAILHPMRIDGMIIGDYPARYPLIEPAWIDTTRQRLGSRAPYHVLQGLQRESALIELWDDLAKIEVPVLLLRGDQEESLLSAEEAQKYVASLNQAMALVFPGSGHTLWEPDRARYLGTIKAFLQGLDTSE
jgi:pimeloyl-ACP methyl ester carboxylesterase